MREKRSRRKVKNKKFSVLLASLALIFAVSICGTTAFLIANTDSVVNTFTPGKIDPPVVNEQINDNVKESVTITNKGTVEAYIRAMVLVTWKDSEGNVYGIEPTKGTDYTMTLPANAKWTKSGNYYYYSGKVSAGADTEALLTQGQLLGTANVPDGYNLSIEILAQSIQADPASAVTEAWGAEAVALVGATN